MKFSRIFSDNLGTEDGMADVAMPHKNSVAPTDIKINGLRFIGYPLQIEQVTFWNWRLKF